MSSSSGDEDSDSQGGVDLRPTIKIKSLPSNGFKNDGSFLEMFKKMQEQQTATPSGTSESIAKADKNPEEPKLSGSKIPSANLNRYVGKRRIGRVLPTGMVKKQRNEVTASSTNVDKQSQPKKGDPWSTYMAEVKKYKQQSCSDEDGSRRPLVK